MLRFRPIAPKPAADGSFSGRPPADKELVVKKRRKRKYVRVNKGVKNSKAEGTDGVLDGTAMVRGVSSGWMSFDTSDRVAAAAPVVMTVVESWVTVECVTEACLFDDGSLGRTDEEKMRNLEADTCPGFVSNGVNEVQWANPAYRRMVDPCDGDREGVVVSLPKTVVWLAAKDRFPVECAAFACRVRVVYCVRGKERCSHVPCDVWRMSSGGCLAWRLDVQAALSLGR
ncbi:hypothetical protein RJ639_044041 [Escallonia herrerae]|uniref:DUF7950 domain-containing protein n=1 Tax=Escallonia herrerae TaxID=1293975 RepID=A0AA89B7H5_9ASTE|nr:hypothetical protein RJ639_044041 [Escallonia herrerae]